MQSKAVDQAADKPTLSYPTRIYLTGFMGAGKSTLGRLLAEKIGYAFTDLDAAIEAAAGAPVREIIERRGEAAFRALERAALHETAGAARLVTAVGGGALATPEAMAWATARGMVVFIRVDRDVLVARLKKAANRPLLQDASGALLPDAALLERIEALMARRLPVYERAHLTVNTSGLSKPEAAALLHRSICAAWEAAGALGQPE